MNWKKAALFGVAFWVSMFILVSVLIAVKVYPAYPIVASLLAGVVSYVLAGYVKPLNQQNALMYGLTWVVVSVVLDWFVTLKFSPDLFGMWTLWLGYALALVAPVLKVKK